jgi:hypothetical protein
MRSFLATVIIIVGTALAVSAQTEADLKKHFEGKSVTMRIDMPRLKSVNVYPEREQPLNYSEYTSRIQMSGTSINRGDATTIRKLKVKDKTIEVELGDGSAQFNVHFTRIDAIVLTPSALMDALGRFVDFNQNSNGVSSLRHGGRFVRYGVVQLGPRTTYLKEGLTTHEVLNLMGEPSAKFERTEGDSLNYSTVTDFARFLGWSTSQPRRTAM